MPEYEEVNLDKRGLAWYLGLSYGIVWLLEGWLWTQGGLTNPLAQYVLMSVMLVPAASAFGVRKFITREGFAGAGLRIGRKRYYIWAWLLFPILFALAGVLTVLLGQARFDPTMSSLLATLRLQAPGADIPPAELLFPVMLLQGMTVGALINCLFTFGEEFGWRGYLTMKLLPLGRNRALLVTGIIWGLWHAPVILMGYNYPTQPVLGVLLMIVFCIWISFMLGWLRLASGSVLTPTLGHAVINGGATAPMFLLAGLDNATGGPLGVIGWIPLGAFVLWLHLTGRLKETA
jgi:membrane protease YdiL (CAAX protease family)